MNGQEVFLMRNEEIIKKSQLILNLREEFTLKDIDKSFRKLAMKYHPDKCADKRKAFCIKKFIEVNNAKEILKKHLNGEFIAGHEPSKTAINRYRKYTREYGEHIKRFYKEWFCL